MPKIPSGSVPMPNGRPAFSSGGDVQFRGQQWPDDDDAGGYDASATARAEDTLKTGLYDDADADD